MKIPKINLFFCTILLFSLNSNFRAQISGSDLMLEIKNHPSKTALPLYKGSEDSLYKIIRKKFPMLHVHPVHHRASLDLDKKGKVTQARIICRYNACDFHPQLVQFLLATNNWSPGKVKGKATA